MAPSEEFSSELFYGLSALLLGHLAFEIWNLPRDRYLIKALNPIVLASIGTYACSMGALLNFFILADDYSRLDFSFIAPNVNNEIGYAHFTMVLACTSSVAAWTAFYSSGGPWLFRLYDKCSGVSSFLKGKFDRNRLVILVGLAIMIRFMLFRSGLHGRVISADAIDGESGSFRAGTEIRHLGSLCYIVIVVTFLGYARNPNPVTGMLRWVILGSETLFGFLFAARSAMVFPFLLAFITSTYCSKRLSKWWLGTAALALTVAMAFGAEFKQFATQYQLASGAGVVDVIADFLSVRDTYARAQHQNESLTSFVVTFSRNKSKVAECSAAIQYADGPEGEWFRQLALQEFLMAPVHGVIPRSISGVPSPQWGLNFKNKVLKRNLKRNYSIGFAPLGVLYFAGGVPVVILGSFIYGCMLRFVSLVVRYGDMGFLMFIVLMSIFYDVNTAVPDVIVDTIRYLVFLPILFRIVFRK